LEHGFRRGVEDGRQRDDDTDVQVAVRPAVEPPADARCHRVVHGRVAKRARDPELCDPTSGRDLRLQADDGVASQQLDRRGWAREVGFREEARREPRRVHLQADREGGDGSDGALHDVVEVQDVCPEGLVAHVS